MIIHQHCYTRECMKEMISVVENPEPILATSRCPPSLKKTVAIIVYQSSLSSSRHHDHQDHQDHHDRHDGHDHHHHIIIVILTASRCPPWLKKTVLSAFHSHHHRRRGFRDWEWEHNTLKYLRLGGRGSLVSSPLMSSWWSVLAFWPPVIRIVHTFNYHHHHLLRHLDHHHSAQQQLLAICWRKLEFSTAGPSLATCARSIIPKIMDYDIATTVKIRQQEYLMMMKTIMFISKIMDYLSLSSSPDIIKIGQRETLTMMKLITMIKPSDDICGLGHTRAPLGMTAHFSADKTLPNSHTNLILWLPFELGMETVIVMIRGIIMIIMMTTDNQKTCKAYLLDFAQEQKISRWVVSWSLDCRIGSFKIIGLKSLQSSRWSWVIKYSH